MQKYMWWDEDVPVPMSRWEFIVWILQNPIEFLLRLIELIRNPYFIAY